MTDSIDSAANQVYRALRGKILSGEIGPDTHLVETTLAEDLNVSRTPVREAIILLKKDRLVNPVNTGGVITRDVLADLQEVLGVRKALETYAVKCAIDLISTEELEEIEDICKEAERLPLDAAAERAKLNASFHERLVAASQNKRLFHAWLDCRDYFLVAQQAYDDDFVSHGVDQHMAILDAIKKRSKATAERLINKHLDSAIKAVTVARKKLLLRTSRSERS